MKLRLKQRLVGAVVLVALAVIFLPMLFDGPQPPQSQVLLEPIPQAPGADYVPRKITLDVPDLSTTQPRMPAQEVPEIKQVVAPDPDAVPEPEPSAPKPASKPAPAPAPVAKGSGWVVQVGSFSNPDNAHALRDRLIGMGFEAYAEPVSGADGKRAMRVRVGPEADRLLAEALRTQLKNKAELDGILRQYP